MGLIDDILKGIPANAVLREQITQLNAQKAAAETENAILKDDLRHANAEIAKLKKQVEEFTHKGIEPDLNQNEIKLLKVFTLSNEPMEDVHIASFAGLKFQVAKFYLQRLEDRDLVSSYQGFYSLMHKGREYLIENNLI